MFSEPAFVFSAKHSPTLYGPRDPATSGGAENSVLWWPRCSHPAPGTPARVQVGTFRSSFVPLHLRCPGLNTVPEKKAKAG